MKVMSQAALEALNTNAKAGRVAWKAGDLAAAERSFIEAWNSIPDPKSDYDYSQSLSRGLVIFYRDTKQFKKARQWIEVMRVAYGPEPSEYVDFTAATVYHDDGDFDAAFEIFDCQFKKYKQRPFEGEDEKYLSFYKARAKIQS